jgi:hypothetical protein
MLEPSRSTALDSPKWLPLREELLRGRELAGQPGGPVRVLFAPFPHPGRESGTGGVLKPKSDAAGGRVYMSGTGINS